MAIHICHQEIRIAKLEADSVGQNRDIQNLVKRLDSLTKGIWALVITLIPAVLTLFGFLVWQVFTK